MSAARPPVWDGLWIGLPGPSDSGAAVQGHGAPQPPRLSVPHQQPPPPPQQAPHPHVQQQPQPSVQRLQFGQLGSPPGYSRDGDRQQPLPAGLHLPNGHQTHPQSGGKLNIYAVSLEGPHVCDHCLCGQKRLRPAAEPRCVPSQGTCYCGWTTNIFHMECFVPLALKTCPESCKALCSPSRVI